MTISIWLFCAVLVLGLGSGAVSTPEATSENAVNDVTWNVVIVGNPFFTRFNTSRVAYDRNVWDMQVYDGRLYLGHGNSNNEGTGGNPGPIELWYYDAASQTFAYDHIVDDEQIDEFVPIGDDLFIPGHDSTTNQLNIYYLQGEQWFEWNNLPKGLHVYDVYSYHGTIYAALGVGNNSDEIIASTSDNGATWTLYRLPVTPVPGDDLHNYRAWKFFEVAGELLVSVMSPYYFLPIHRPDGSVGNLFQTDASPVYRLVTDAGDPHFEEVPVDFFAGLAHPEVDWIEGRIARPVRFDNNTVYLGVKTVTDHNWTAFGLFSVDDSYNVTVLPLDAGVLPWDTMVEQNALLVLTGQQLADGTFTVSVRETCNLQDWREVLEFHALTFSRSFALYNGDFYFGQGTQEDDKALQSGNILRVTSDAFSLACP